MAPITGPQPLSAVSKLLKASVVVVPVRRVEREIRAARIERRVKVAICQDSGVTPCAGTKGGEVVYVPTASPAA